MSGGSKRFHTRRLLKEINKKRTVIKCHMNCAVRLVIVASQVSHELCCTSGDSCITSVT